MKISIRREIFGRRAFNWLPKSCQPLARSLEGLDLLGACAISVKLSESLGPYSLGDLAKEIEEAKGKP